MIVHIIWSKKVYINLCPILDGYQVTMLKKYMFNLKNKFNLVESNEAIILNFRHFLLSL